ncbi:TetR/AcrR family transcriptional regulator [Dongia soli]|uniref:TetR/AcrR family transcriptional regulator n=1 Tax=Dongia soli TaxID=600628 RepID=A0ABU5EEW6_9PROT|nr:TetR/AcrR family transcriptional regulator [Dongia soli]MDY0884569.1 TetR/AcrR family transcriptional regulator [Dongia soli]
MARSDPISVAAPVPLAASRRGSARERILTHAEAAVLAKGFAATSIDEIIAAAGITKSGFFYHFKDKNDLAKALIERYIRQDKEILDDLFRRARELHDDPLHGFLVGLKLFAEMMASLPVAHPGCLAASFCYQDQLSSRDIRDLNAAGMQAWRDRFRQYFQDIADKYPPRDEIDTDKLADMAVTLVEGGLVLGRALQDGSILPQQILIYRDIIRSIFMPS